MFTISRCGKCGQRFTHDNPATYKGDREHLLSIPYNTAVQEALDRMIFHDTFNCGGSQ